MSEFSSNDVFTLTTARILPARPEAVFSAIADPALLTRWWGPNGFSSSFQTFDFRPGGDWVFTLHGPDGTDYPNVCRFIEIVADQRVVIEHLNMHWFELTLSLAPQDGGTRNGWQQRFDSPEACARMAALCAPSNEQNLDRLASVLVLQPESIGT